MFKLFKQAKTQWRVIKAHQRCLSTPDFKEKLNAANEGRKLLELECNIPWKYQFSEDRVKADFVQIQAESYFVDKDLSQISFKDATDLFDYAVILYSPEEPCEDQVIALLRLSMCLMETDTHNKSFEITSALKHLLLANKLLQEIDFQSSDLDIHVMLKTLEACSQPVFIKEYDCLEIAERVITKLKPKLSADTDPNWLFVMFAYLAKTHMSHAKNHPDTIKSVIQYCGDAKAIARKHNFLLMFADISFDQCEFLLSTKAFSDVKKIKEELIHIDDAFKASVTANYDHGTSRFHQYRALLMFRLACLSNEVESKYLENCLNTGIAYAQKASSNELARFNLLFVFTLVKFKIPAFIGESYNPFTMLDTVLELTNPMTSIEHARAGFIGADLMVDAGSSLNPEYYAQAISILEQVISFFEKNGTAHDLGQAKASLANAHAMRNDPRFFESKEIAINILLDLLNSNEIRHNPNLHRKVCIDLANSFLDRARGNRYENGEKAFEYIQMALKITDMHKEPREYATIISNLMMWYVRSEQTVESLADFAMNQGEKLADLFNKSDSLGAWINLKISTVELLQYQWIQNLIGEEEFKKVESIYKELLDCESLGKLPQQEMKILKGYKKLLEIKIFKNPEQRDEKELSLVYDRIIELAKREHLPFEQMSTLVGRGFSHVEKSEWQRADQYFYEALQLFDTEFYDKENCDFLTFIEKTMQWQLSSIPFVALMNGRAGPAITLNEQLKASQLRKGKLLANFEQSIKSGAQKETETFYYRSIKSWVLMPFLTFESGVFALIPPQTLSNVEPIVSAKTDLGIDRILTYLGVGSRANENNEIGLSKALSHFKETNDTRNLSDALSKTFEELENRLGNWIVKTLANYQALEVQSLVILPSGPLSHLPVNMLTANGQFLIERLQISLCPSLHLLQYLEMAQETTDCSMCFIGDTTAKDLPFIKVEQQACDSVFKEKAVSKANWNSNGELCTSLATANYWHFACHGEFNILNFSNSSLKIGDLHFSISQVEKIGQNTDIKLVVLSACESGLLDFLERFNECSGFPTEFIKQGANAVIATLWPVADQITTLFFAKFYEQHLKEGLSISLAFQITQNWLRTITIKEILEYYPTLCQDQNTSRLVNTYCRQLGQLKSDIQPYNAPAYWAAFYLYGAIR